MGTPERHEPETHDDPLPDGAVAYGPGPRRGDAQGQPTSSAEDAPEPAAGDRPEPVRDAEDARDG
ncbi:hypothetical protein ACWEGQ_37180, partial [Streptomyces seoulensis]